MSAKRKLKISEFHDANGPVLDVRSPIEFEHGNIPGAFNIPLFSNEERAEIGICYKTDGRDAAIKLGLGIVGPRLGEIIGKALEIAPGKTVRVHCSRGGMRSKSVAWLLETAGFDVFLLDGGYKSYRRWVRETVSQSRGIRILGGLTGTGKTRILKALAEQGEQVIDLEGLANHRGSSFGGLGMPTQPSTQHFENLIAEQVSGFKHEYPVWIESESGRVGNCWVPEELYRQMKSAPVVRIIRSVEERLDILTEMYGDADRLELVEATRRIGRKLGGEKTAAAINFIQCNEIREACRVILEYYDNSYLGDLKRRPRKPAELDVGSLSAHDAAKMLIEQSPVQNPASALTA